jgi:hypothetical protein
VKVEKRVFEGRVAAQAPAYSKWQGHDGDGLRIKDVQGSTTTYYLRSTVLGGKVIAEISPSGAWQRRYVYAGEQLVAVQSGGNYFVHQDPITKSQRITDSSGTIIEAIELDPLDGVPGFNPGFIPAWSNGWNRTANPTEDFINYSQLRTTSCSSATCARTVSPKVERL